MTAGLRKLLDEEKEYNIEEGKAIGLTEGKAIGKALGATETNEKIIKNMLASKKFSLSDISIATNCSIDQIERIREAANL